MSKFTEEDDALLGKLGVEVEVKKKATLTAYEERIIAGFEEIQRFVEEYGKKPQHGHENDIFERMYAIRLERLSSLEECRELLKDLDHQQILDDVEKEELLGEDMDDDELLSALGVKPKEGSLQDLKHVRHSKEIQSADKVANRQKCNDFGIYKPLFEKVKSEIESKVRTIVKCNDKGEVDVGNFYILYGQMLYIADQEEAFIDKEGRNDRRLKIIFDNGTESNMLRRSLQKRLWDDSTSRRIVEPALGPQFTDVVNEGDQVTGVIYVLRSDCQHPDIVKNREIIHKIGYTTDQIDKRIADASNQPTYLLSEVQVVDKYVLYNLNAGKFEKIIHKIFSNARLEIELKDRFGKPYKPREWFLVPLPVIRDAIEKIKDGTISNYLYNRNSGQLEISS